MKALKFDHLIRRINWYPPYLGMAVRVKFVSDDFTHFGGALYAMCDPFYAFIITQNFGDDYIVWDKSAAIEFLKPARGTILGVFEIGSDWLAEMRTEVDTQGKSTFHFAADLVDEAGVVVAHVKKEVYVRPKSKVK